MKIINKRIRNVQQFIPLPFNFFSTQHASHLKHRFFINIMIMQTEREGYNYLQVPAQYSIHMYIYYKRWSDNTIKEIYSGKSAT